MKESIINKLLSILKDTLPIRPTINDINTSLLSLGASSLIIMRIKRSIDTTFSVNIPLKDFFNDLKTIESLANHISNNIPQETLNTMANDVPYDKIPDLSGSDIVTSEIEYIFNQQLKAASNSIEGVISQQLEFLKKKGIPIDKNYSNKIKSLANNMSMTSFSDDNNYVDHSLVINSRPEQLSKKQQKFIDEIVEKYNRKTINSKKHAQKYHSVLSDWINTLNYRYSLKDIQYPIVANKSLGSKIWDIDDNEYIDIAMGYGVNYLGNSPSFTKNAITEQLKNGFHLGPQFELTGKVCELISELTGVERVTFCNSGTEAVMCAVRIARAVTKRDKIVLFAGSFHGTFDGILAAQGESTTIAQAPGIPFGMIKDVVVLDYDSPKSLDYIKSNGNEIAAVLTEPVQSRKPGLQPREFLTDLRQITKETGTALIFDEVITGFRICPGGAQAYFNIRADIVIYGKIPAGGMPIGIVAGKSTFMNAIDGGHWNMDDDTSPLEKTTIFGGTFCKHPLTMASSLAAMQFIKDQGPQLQKKTNKLTAYLADSLNSFFEQENVPIRIHYFSSVFRFESFGKYELLLQPIEMDIIFYLLMYKGIYTWEKRICFLSIDHTYDEIDYIINAVKESISEMRQAGFSFESEISSPMTIQATSVQKRLYTLCQLEMGDIAYHQVGALSIKGDLNKQIFENHFKRLIKRHESLRTAIIRQDDTILQEIMPDVPFKLIHKELAENNLKESLNNLIYPFDLSKPPLMRVIIVTTEDRYILLVDMHHIISDGMSLNILFQELMNLFNNESLPKIDTQYKDFVQWEKDYLSSEQFQTDEKYWLNKFSDELPLLNLPTDFPRPPRQSFTGYNIYFKIGKEQTKALQKFVENLGTSLFTVLFAAYYLMLNKLTGQQDIIIGIPVGGRPFEKFQNVVGMFVNTIAFRYKTQGVNNNIFLDFIESFRNDLFDSYEHENYPFEILVKKLKLKRDISHNPIFDTMFVYENADERVIKINELSCNQYHFKPKVSIVDLSLEAIFSEGELNLRIEYNTNLFKKDTIHRYSQYYQNIVKEIVDNPQIALNTLNFLSEKEKNKLLFEFNNTKVDYPKDKCIHEFFENQVNKTPDEIAVVFENTKLTYKELNARSNQMAHYLISLGVGPESLVGIYLERSIDLIVAIFGILKANGAYVPISPEYPGERIDFILKDSGVNILLSQKKLSLILPKFNGNIIYMDTVQNIYNKPETTPVNKAKASNLAYVIYTSGSTGVPKGVMIEHMGLCNMAIHQSKTYFIKTGARVLQFASVSFDTSVSEIFMTLCTGATLYLASKDDIMPGDPLTQFVEKNKITHITIVPSALSVMSPEKFTSPDVIITAGEAVNLEIAKRWSKNAHFFNAYGPTEGSVCATIYKYTGNEQHIIPIGKPNENIKVYILDKDLHLCPAGISGELHISGDCLARGYINRDELTRDKFIPNPYESGTRLYKTGDVARWLSDGNIDFLGRIDNQLKIRGFRVEVGEIETVLSKHNNVNEIVVIANKTESGNKKLIAYIIEKKENKNPSIYKQFLYSKLPDYMIPDFFVFLDAFPLTPNRKIDKKNLPLPDITKVQKEYTAPVTDKEQILVQVFAKVLGLKRVGVYDNFFELGGDSIISVKIISEALKKGVSLTIKDLFERQTPYELAKINKQAIEEKASIYPVSLMVSKDDLKDILLTNHIDEKNIKEIYPLSPTQEGMLFHSIYDSHSAAFLQVDSFSITGDFNVDIFIKSWNILLKRYDVFRTIYLYKGLENPLQIVLNEREIEYVYKNISSLNKDQQKSFIAKCKQEEIARKFDLTNDVLMKLNIIELDESNFEVIWTRHHILMDGWCSEIIINDLLKSYVCFKNNNEPDFMEVVPYSSYISWLNKETDPNAATQYWNLYLENYKQTATLIQSGKTHSTNNGTIEKVKLVLSQKTTRKLKQLAIDNHVTQNTLLQCIWGIILAKHNNTDDVIFGSVVSGRPPELPGVEQIVGLFLNTIPVRIIIEENETFSSLMNKIQKQAIECEKFHYSSLADIQTLSPLGNQLFDHVFIFENYSLSGDTHEIIDKYDLGFSIGEISEDNIQINYNYFIQCFPLEKITIEFCFLSNIFSNQFMDEIKNQLLTTIETIVEKQDITVSDIILQITGDDKAVEEDLFIKSAMDIDEDF